MGCCQAKANRDDILSAPPTANQGAQEWSDYGNTDLQGILPTFGSAEGKDEEDRKRFWTWDRNAVLPIRYAAKGMASEKECPAMTVTQIFKKAAALHPNKDALVIEDGVDWAGGKAPVPPATPRSEWGRRWTWGQYYAECREVGKACLAQGMEKKDSVCIFGFNSPEWMMAALGATLAGGCSAGIYPTDTAEQVEFKARHSAAVVAFVETAKKAAVFQAAAPRLPKLKCIVVWSGAKTTVDGESKSTEDGSLPVYTWDEFKALGAEVKDATLDAREEEQEPGSACSYIYTSGTTGRPKAVMVSHDNIVFIATTAKRHIEDNTVFGSRGEERVISYLPLSHVAGMMIDIIMPLVMTASDKGSTKSAYTAIHFARAYDLKAGSIGDRLRAIQPSLFLGVPRVWEKIQAKLLAISAANPLTGLKLSIKNWAKASALHNAQNSQIGGTGEYPPNKFCGLLGHDFFDKKVLSVIKQKLGLDECVFFGTTAAPIRQETVEFYGAIGIELCEVYGMSESTGATTFSTPNAHVWGSVGWSLAGAETKVLCAYRDPETGDLIKTSQECARYVVGSGRPTDFDELPKADKIGDAAKAPKDFNQGEICFRGRHIMMGYMANPDMGEAHVAEIIQKNEGSIDAEGWCRSGDKGTMDTIGMLRITGRYKELIIGAGGENVAPIPVEDDVAANFPGASNVMMVGNKRPYCIALITLKAKGANNEVPGSDELDGEAATLGATVGVTTISEAIKSEKFQALLEAAIVKTNKNPAAVPKPPSSIKRFTILPTNYSVETGEFTPTQKLKRSFVENKYKDLIEKVYAAEGRASYVSSA